VTVAKEFYSTNAGYGITCFLVYVST